MARRIVSIASAPGWKARFAAEDDFEDFRVITLVAWALVENADAEREIVGVVQRGATPEHPQGWLSFADEVTGFDGYVFTGLVTQAQEP